MGVIQLLIPNSSSWRGPKLRTVLSAVELSFDRLKYFFDGIRRASCPSGALLLRDEVAITPDEIVDESSTCGFAQCGDSECIGPPKEKKIVTFPSNGMGTLYDDWEVEAPLFTAAGGQSGGYLQDQITQRWPDVVIVPMSFIDANMCGSAQCGEAMCADVAGLGPSYPVSYFYVRGSVDNRTKFNRLVATISRIFPAHMEPIYQVTIANENNSSIIGMAECGVAQCGA